MTLSSSAGLLASLCLALAPVLAQADVVLDGTLRAENEGVAPLDALGDATYRIEQDVGITSSNGRNLFHSFREFSLADGELALFTGDASIENVVARVTTPNLPSILEGTLRSEVENANFFFVNPAGIEFRNVRENEPGNKIEVPGSFYASTADRLVFSNGETFDASGLGGTNPVAILSVPQAWEFSSGLAGDILVDQTLPLGVPNDETLSLVAGNLRVERGASILAGSGQIQTAAVGTEAVRVPLALETWDPQGAGLGELEITGGALLRTRAIGSSGGRIVMRGGRLVVDGGAEIQSNGDLATAVDAVDLVFSESITVDGGGLVSATQTSLVGVGGVRMRAPAIELSNGGEIRLGGNAAGAELDAERVTVRDGGLIRSLGASVRGGDIVIRTGELEITGGTLVTRADTTGRAGDISVSADEAVRLADSGAIGSVSTAAGEAGNLALAAPVVTLDGASEISSTSEVGSTGAGGDVRVARSLDGTQAADLLSVRGGSQIEVTTESNERGGDIRIHSARVELAGSSTEVDGAIRPSGLFARSGRSGASGSGDAGSIEIEGDVLDLLGAATISARSFGTGRSGTIDIVANEGVFMRDADDRAPNISIRTQDADAGGVAEGEPGLSIETARLELRGGAQISASSLGTGEAGDVFISAGDIEIRGGNGSTPSTVFAEAAALSADGGASGQIELVVRRNLVLADGGRLSVRTLGGGRSNQILANVDGDVRISEGAVISSIALSSGNAGDVALTSRGLVSITGDGSVTAESLGSADAGDIRISAEDGISLESGRVTSIATGGAGGSIALATPSRISIVDGGVTTSVVGRTDEGDAGNIVARADEVILAGASRVLARAELGDGGAITIRAESFLASTDSVVDASSDLGIDGTVRIEAPDTNLKDAVAQLPDDFLAGRALLRSPCAAEFSSGGSFVIAGRRGAPAGPQRPLPSRMPIPAASHGDVAAVAEFSPFETASLARCPLDATQERHPFVAP